MAAMYMKPRSYELNRSRFGNRQFCVMEFFDYFHCLIKKDYRKITITDTFGRPIKQFPQLTQALRYIPVKHLTLDCQMRAKHSDLTGRELKLASSELARGKVRSGDDITVIVNGIPMDSKQDYTYRRAMMDLYIEDSNVIKKNPILYTGFDVNAVDWWAGWAEDNDRDGILILFKNYRYIRGLADHYLIFRTQQNEKDGPTKSD